MSTEALSKNSTKRDLLKSFTKSDTERIPQETHTPPPTGGDMLQQESSSAPNATAADGTVQSVLMSVYTPQARAAAGGITQIQAQIQAAIDQANTAFVNSNMITRFFLSHTEEVAYNDSGN